jgi:hypothetical protein
VCIKHVDIINNVAWNIRNYRYVGDVSLGKVVMVLGMVVGMVVMVAGDIVLVVVVVVGVGVGACLVT